MTQQENLDRIWNIIEQVGVCMLTTQVAGRVHARPIEARPDREAALIFFVTDFHSGKAEEIERTPDVGAFTETESSEMADTVAAAASG